MTASEIIEAFASADMTQLPSMGDLEERLQILAVLCVGQEQADRPVMTPAEISTVLRDVHGYDVSRQRIEGVLATERGTVARRQVDGRRAYQLMKPGREELDQTQAGVTFIDPAEGFKGLREVHGLLEPLSGELRVCDPYADARTLDMLAEASGAASIRLLTRNIKKESGFKQAISAFEKQQGASVEVRRAPAGVLHDRYVIHDEGMLLFGTSLNGLGLKQSFVVNLGEDVRAATLATFEATWDAANAL